MCLRKPKETLTNTGHMRLSVCVFLHMEHTHATWNTSPWPWPPNLIMIKFLQPLEERQKEAGFQGWQPLDVLRICS